MVKNRLLTNSLRTIKKSILRFLSLLIISFLGSFVFAGLLATSPDMLNSLDKYLDSENIYDIRVTSYLGFKDEAIEKIKQIEDINTVEVGAKKAYEVTIDDKTTVIELNVKLDMINQASFEHELNPGEIALEKRFFEQFDLKTGDYIYIGGYYLKISGYVDSALYFNNANLQGNRGNTNLGSGTIQYYAFVDKSFFDTFTDVYITVNNAKELKCYKDNYTSLINSVKDEIDKVGDVYGPAYYDELVSSIKKIFPNATDKQLNSLIPSKAKNWSINDRLSNLTYQEYIDDSNSISNLSKIFPLVFFGVAILICLISMAKMVENDRSEIGALKSLGFSNKEIISKYIIYASLATIIGGILGALLGIVIIPLMINNIYRILFNVPNFILGMNWVTTILAVVISYACVILATIYQALKVLKEKPSELLRPKSPKPGKKVLLERIKPLWRHISFSWKVTIRNIARFKKRVIVTVVGLAGCTALMLVGFGVRDSIKDIAEYQFNNVFKYDAMAYLQNDDASAFENESITNYAKLMTVNATTSDNTTVIILVYDSVDGIKDFMTIRNDKTKEVITPTDDLVFISEKTAKLKSIKSGDTFTLDVETAILDVKIDYLFENYINNYVIMTKNMYESLGGTYEANMVYFKTVNLTSTEEDELTQKLYEDDSILYVSFNTKLIKQVDNMLSSLNNVVIILIVLSCMLSFVVLYNLNNINIHERKREISTLKVLGFYTNEVDNYITRENIINTILGIGFGLILGFFLTNAVVRTVEIERARFIYNISPLSFLYTALLSLLFTLVVNVIDHFELKKIDMIESLKSVE